MTGIHCALQGRLGVDVEMRRSESGKDRARGVGEVDELTLVSVAVFEKKARAIEGLATGAVYCEGRMRGLARMQHSAPGWRR